MPSSMRCCGSPRTNCGSSRKCRYRVVINEAVGLTKRFGATDGHKFVNAVLDRAAREWRAHER